MSNIGRNTFIVIVTALVAFGMAAPAIAATADDPVTDHLLMGDWDEKETAPNPVINTSVTTAAQDLSEGKTHTAIAGYEDDNGDWVAGADSPFVVNTTFDESDGSAHPNPYDFKPGHIEDSSYTAFPDKSDRTWTNSSGWTVNAGSGNVTISNSTVASNVDGVHFDTSSNGDSGSGAVTVFSAKYDRWDGELDSDENKRVLQVGMDIDTLDANTEIQLRVYDESGDYKEINASTAYSDITSNSSSFATGTGDFVYQIKLNHLTTHGGSSSLDNIENVTVRVRRTSGSTGDADFTMSWLDLRKKGKNKLGEKRATTDDAGNDPDSDSDWDEFQTIHNSTDDISVYSMETLDSEYDDAVVHDLTYPARYQADGLDSNGEDGDYVIYWEENENPGFANVLNVTYDLELPGSIDLSYGTSEVRMTQKWSDNRYLSLEQASEVSDSTNLSDASYSSVTLSSKGDPVTIQSSSVDSGERFLVHYELELTQEEVDSIREDAEDEGAAAPATGTGGGVFGGIVDFVTNPIGALISLAVGFVGFRWWRAR